MVKSWHLPGMKSLTESQEQVMVGRYAVLRCSLTDACETPFEFYN